MTCNIRSAFLVSSCFLFVIFAGAQNGNKPGPNTYGSVNVTASRLIGTWKTNVELSKRLIGNDGIKSDAIQFIQDSSVLKVIPSKHLEYIKGKTIFLSGYFTMRGIRYPFLLTEDNGNTRLLFFRDRNGIKNDDGESFILFVAVSGNKKNDLLSIGGDFNNQPFKCWDRIN